MRRSISCGIMNHMSDRIDQPPLKASPTSPMGMSSWAVPSAVDIQTWDAMTREQQLMMMQNHFASSDCTTITTSSVGDIIERTRAQRETK